MIQLIYTRPILMKINFRYLNVTLRFASAYCSTSQVLVLLEPTTLTVSNSTTSLSPCSFFVNYVTFCSEIRTDGAKGERRGAEGHLDRPRWAVSRGAIIRSREKARSLALRSRIPRKAQKDSENRRGGGRSLWPPLLHVSLDSRSVSI